MAEDSASPSPSRATGSQSFAGFAVHQSTQVPAGAVLAVAGVDIGTVCIVAVTPGSTVGPILVSISAEE